MPNYCSFTMKVVANRKKSVETFVEWLKGDYFYADLKGKDEKEFLEQRKEYLSHYPLVYKKGNQRLYADAEKHFFRIEDAYAERIVKEGSHYAGYIFGSCAWSVYCCMMPGDHSYYKSMCEGEFAPLAQEHATNLPKASEELGLAIEVFSKEPGCEFAEHYLIKKGDVEVDEETKYSCYLYDEPRDYEKVLESYKIPKSFKREELVAVSKGKATLKSLKEKGLPSRITKRDIRDILEDTKTFEEFKKECELPPEITEASLNDGWIEVGGYDADFSI